MGFLSASTLGKLVREAADSWGFDLEPVIGGLQIRR